MSFYAMAAAASLGNQPTGRRVVHQHTLVDVKHVRNGDGWDTYELWDLPGSRWAVVRTIELGRSTALPSGGHEPKFVGSKSYIDVKWSKL